MTYSLIGRCAATGQFGAITTTSSIAVGSRVTFCAAGVGAVLTQHRTDPRLGPCGLALLRSGCSAQEAVDALVASTPHAGWRQLAALDRQGRTAAFSGDRNKPAVSEAIAVDCCAIGNILANEDVAPAMVAAFQAQPDAPLAERLMQGLEHGYAAGGEIQPVRSAHLLVVATESFPLVDLRVDWSDEPVVALRALWERYRPMMDDFVQRALDPDAAPVL